MKPIEFRGDSLRAPRRFPDKARRDAGFELDAVQRGLPASDSKAMPTIGRGVEELRVWDDAGTYRVIYTARLADAVYVLHAFQKKTQVTAQREIEMAKNRYRALMEERR